jgi:hypothetical protein
MNTLTALSGTLFAAARIVPTALTGFLGAVNRNFDDKGVNKGGTVKVTVAPRMTSGAMPAASMAFAAGADRTPTTIDFALNQTTEVTWNMQAEEERQLLISGVAQDLFKQTLEQAFLTQRNEIEAYVGTVAKNAASRSIGVSGTAPFAANFDLIADARMQMDLNGAPPMQSLVMNSRASNGLRKRSELFKVNEAGTADLLRNGVLGRLHNFDLRESAGVATHTKGTGTGYLTTALLPIGTTTIPVDTGTGTIVAGDVITFAADATYSYVVKTALTGGNVIIQEPGLKVAIADNNAVTVVNNYEANIALSRDSIAAVVRPALQPQAAHIEQTIVTDDETKYSALLLRVVGDQMSSWYLRAIFDAFAPNPYGIHSVRG